MEIDFFLRLLLCVKYRELVQRTHENTGLGYRKYFSLEKSMQVLMMMENSMQEKSDLCAQSSLYAGRGFDNSRLYHGHWLI